MRSWAPPRHRDFKRESKPSVENLVHIPNEHTCEELHVEMDLGIKLEARD